MGSPLAIERTMAPQRALLDSTETLLHGRLGVLANRIAMHLETLVPRGRARCLDIGCGDMTLAEAVHEHAPRTDWLCIDVHPAPAAVQDEARWSKYRQFDGKQVPYLDDQFDVALLCDVLHHTAENAASLLAEARRVAQRVIVKDHFEHGAYSRSMLRLMDFAGGSAHGAAVPECHFTRDGFVQLAAGQGLVIESIDCGRDLDGRLPVERSWRRPDSHFIAVLHRDRA